MCKHEIRRHKFCRDLEFNSVFLYINVLILCCNTSFHNDDLALSNAPENRVYMTTLILFFEIEKKRATFRFLSIRILISIFRSFINCQKVYCLDLRTVIEEIPCNHTKSLNYQ